MSASRPPRAADCVSRSALAEDRTLPLVTYVLMLLGVVTGVTALLALGIALYSRRTASDMLRSHYDFIVQTFWVAAFCMSLVFSLAVLWSYMGYEWLPSIARLVFLLVSLWVMVRTAVGILRLGAGDGIAESTSLGIPGRVEGRTQAA